MELKTELTNITEAVNPVIKEILSKNVEEKNAEAVVYQCMVGGKRIRPALVILSCQMLGGKISDALYPAASIEVLHNSTLVIDDIIDHSEFRRDLPTCWNKYGKSIAECASMTYLASVFEALTSSPYATELVNLYGKTIKVIVDGEIKDILFERSGREEEPFVVGNRYKDIKREDYFDMVSKKTAFLLKSSCEAGGICAGATEAQIKALGEYGYNMGVAFQVQDDILDIFGDEKEFGKKIGKDIIEKKMGNFVMLLALEKLGQEEAKKIEALLESSRDVTDEDITEVAALIVKTDARKEAEETAKGYIEKSLKALETLPDNEYRQLLVDLAHYVVERKK